MPRILRLSPQRRKGRTNLYFDNGQVIGVANKLLADFHLASGENISERQIERLIAADNQEKGYQKALRLLARRPQSEKEIASKLSSYFQKFIPAAAEKKKIISRVLEKLRRHKFSDDQAFASWWLEQRQTRKASSRRRIEWELKRKGINSDIISALLENYDELESARRLAAKKIGQYREKTQRQRRQKLWLWLQGKGFSADTIKIVIDEVVANE